MNMKRILTIALGMMLFASMSFAAGTPKAMKAPGSWSGYLVDKMCSKKMTDAKAPKHSKECLTEEHCASSGFGVFTGGKWTAFDKKGNTMAANLLKNSSKEKDMQVVVIGKMKGSKIHVADLKEKM